MRGVGAVMKSQVVVDKTCSWLNCISASYHLPPHRLPLRKG